MLYDVAIVGGGPAGASCAAFCARSGLHVVLLDREKFPREKVCGDCLNPAIWTVLRQLGVEDRARQLAHGKLERVDFVTLSGSTISVALPEGEEIAIKRSLFDDLLLNVARDLGVEVRENVTVTGVERAAEWRLSGAIRARFLVAADGRNSTVARLLGLLPRFSKERVALQAHVRLPQEFGNRVVLQLLPGGYSGQAPVNGSELNLCLVGRAKTLPQLRAWAARQFKLSPDQQWRTITPLTRAPIAPRNRDLFLVGDAARVVEPFTGEGIFYALRSGELAADAIINGSDYARAHAAMYSGRLWINRLARAAVISPRFGSGLLQAARLQPWLLKFLTAKITR
ncbi:MAG: NAD(P)/FAD-dependent oxidoreductase [Chthoniobacterales bacterium]